MSRRDGADYGAVVLEGRLRNAIARLNPDLPSEAWDDALAKLTRPAGSNLVTRNREFHRMLANGTTVEYLNELGAIDRPRVRFVDFEEVAANDFLSSESGDLFREPEHPARRLGTVRQRPPALRHRAEKSR